MSQIPHDLVIDTRNIYNSLVLELAWKRGRLREGHWYLKDLAENGPKCRQICGEYMVQFCEEFHRTYGRQPRILDVGCGPITSLAFLSYSAMADVVGVDVIADDYRDLLAQSGVRSPARQIAGSGENLDRLAFEAPFDVVFSRNALDHNLCPGLTWLNMFNLLPVGAVLMQSHSIREATQQANKQLHQFDIFPDADGHLYIADSYGVEFSLTRDLPLEVELNMQNHNADGTGWVTTSYRKTGEDASPGFVRNVLGQLQTAFLDRSAWALQMERTIFNVVTERDGQKPAFDLQVARSRTPAGPRPAAASLKAD